jgi:hypothetical protein
MTVNKEITDNMNRDSYSTAAWYTQIPASDRQVVDAVSRWLAPVPWQLFATFTFPWDVATSTADAYFRRFINDLERALRHNVCFVAGKERKTSSLEAKVSWHFHAALTAHCHIPLSLVEELWRRIAGKGKKTVTHPEGDSIDVRAFDRDRMAIEYCLKSMNHCEGEWRFRWLELFNPNIPWSGAMNHRKVRQRKRSDQQALSCTAQASFSSGASRTGIESVPS